MSPLGETFSYMLAITSVIVIFIIFPTSFILILFKDQTTLLHNEKFK